MKVHNRRFGMWPCGSGLLIQCLLVGVIAAQSTDGDPQLPVAVAPIVGEWTPNRVLPDSSRHLNWGKPRQVRIAEMHRGAPSYLDAKFRQPPDRIQKSLKLRPGGEGDVRRATFIELTDDLPRPDVTDRSTLTVAPTMPRNRIHHAEPIDVVGPAAHPKLPPNESPKHDRDTLRLAGALQEDNVDDAFDDILNELMPEEASPPAAIPPDDLQLNGSNGQSRGAAAEPTRADDFATDNSGPPAEGGETENVDDFFGTLEDPRDNANPAAAAPGSDGLPDTSTDDLFDSFSEPDSSPSDLPQLDPAESEPLPDLNELQPAPSEDGLSREDADADDLGADDFAEDSSPGSGTPYNGRDCPAEMQSLRDAWSELRRQPVREITLDITPMIEPNKSATEEAEARLDNLAMAPPRSWRNRQGAVLVEGNLVDFRNSHVIVRDTAGKTQRLSWYDLSNEDLCFVSAWWELPNEFNPDSGTYTVRNWTMSTFTWTASALCHKPLYFEEVQLERYGHSAGPMKQAMLSGVHFFGNIFFLPYHIGLNPPSECKYVLGYYRPGSCAPWLLPAIPLDARAARMQVHALVGGLTLLP